jgi:ankyrin repeat protein
VAGERKRKLFEAIYRGDEKRLRKQLDRDVSPDVRDDGGQTALYIATVQDELQLVHVLLRSGADPDRANAGDGGETPLCAAASQGKLGIVQLLLAAGADPDAREADGLTPLIWAVQGGWFDCASALLEAGANPNRRDPAGRTALHWAASRGSLRIARLLLVRGAHPHPTDHAARTPWAIARDWAGLDLEAELVRTVMAEAPEGSTAELRRLIVVEQVGPDGRVRGGREIECSHADIAALLEPSWEPDGVAGPEPRAPADREG